MGRVGARRGQRGRGRGAVVAPGRDPRDPRPRRTAHQPGTRHRAARRLPGPRRAPAARAHPGARRPRARADEPLASDQRHRVPRAAARPHRAHHRRLRARRRRHADPRDGRPAHALLGRAAGHRRARAAGGRRRQLGRRRPPPALLPRVARAARLAPTWRSRWASAISSPPAGSSRASPSPARTGGRCTPSRLERWSACGWCSRSRARCATGCGSSASCPRRRASSRSRSAAWGSSACRCARVSRCTGASSRAGTGGRRIPFSLSAAPDGRRLRITVKDVGDYTRRLASLAGRGRA